MELRLSDVAAAWISMLKPHSLEALGSLRDGAWEVGCSEAREDLGGDTDALLGAC